jgi:uroporphyrin-III C-methyltransferase
VSENGEDPTLDVDEHSTAAADRDPSTARAGTVYLVGSGPGDPELLTVKARRLIESADVVLHDRLSGPDVHDIIPEHKREDVGKRAGGEGPSQAAINDRLVDLARERHSVVRLKGGDPFLFGRGGEELDHLASEGVPVEVVPGVTSALAAPAVAGIPATHRDRASSVTFVTGHEDPSKPESIVDWDALAETGGTLVVLMGVGRLPEYTAALREAGMDDETPVALVERGTWPDQQVATGTLETIVAARDEAGIEPPAITVIGDVAATHDRVEEWLRSPYGHCARDDRTERPVEESPE